MKQKTVQKSIRFPNDLYSWIDNLPEEEGTDFASKTIRLLFIGKRQLEKEREILKEIESKDGAYSVTKDQFDELNRKHGTG
jgi:hypothetical protein